MERKKKKTQPRSLVWPRASISFPPELYGTLTELAKEKKVSLAWVVRDAAEKYVANRPSATKKAHLA